MNNPLVFDTTGIDASLVAVIVEETLEKLGVEIEYVEHSSDLTQFTVCLAEDQNLETLRHLCAKRAANTRRRNARLEGESDE